MNRLSDAGSIPAWSIEKVLDFQGLFSMRSSLRDATENCCGKIQRIILQEKGRTYENRST